jgi:hypothetical protein
MASFCRLKRSIKNKKAMSRGTMENKQHP